MLLTSRIRICSSPEIFHPFNLTQQGITRYLRRVACCVIVQKVSFDAFLFCI